MSVVVNDLSKIYGSQYAVNHLKFTAERGKILGFLGPNGAGKTTTMKMLTTFLAPSSGSATICGYNIIDSPIDVKRNIGYLPEHNPLYKDMYVREYLIGFARLLKVVNPMSRVDNLIQMTGLSLEQNKLISSLSKGYRQRVGLAQALLHDPEVLILDEPTSGLDPNQLVEIRNLIRNIGNEKTLIFSTHIMQEVNALCDRVIIINHGQKVLDESIEELQNHMNDRQIIQLEYSHGIDISILKKIEGVVKVEDKGKNKYQITAKNNIEVRDLIFNQSVANHWTLRELKKEKSSVESIFNELTVSQQKRDK